jgi:hypothetical protein
MNRVDLRRKKGEKGQHISKCLGSSTYCNTDTPLGPEVARSRAFPVPRIETECMKSEIRAPPKNLLRLERRRLTSHLEQTIIGVIFSEHVFLVSISVIYL